MKLTLTILPFLTNNYSLLELLDSEETKRVEKSKCGGFGIKVALVNLMIAVSSFFRTARFDKRITHTI